MSAPNTNVEKQAKRHKTSMVGIAASIIFAIGLFLLFIVWLAGSGDAPDGAEVVIDGRTGTAESQ